MCSVLLLFILLVLQSSLTKCEEDTSLGCASTTNVDQKIVDFAMQQLSGAEGGLCKKNVVKVENFKTQVQFRII